MLMIRPRDRRRSGKHARVTSTVPIKLTARVRSKQSRGVSSSGAIAGMMPALLTTAHSPVDKKKKRV